MRAAIVLGDDLHVFVPVASMKFVLDAEVGKMHGVIEVRELVVACPVFDLARIAIGASVTVRPASVPLLEPLLVLALELVVEDHAVDVRALFTKPLLFAEVRSIELTVVRQLARPVHAGIERLLPLVIAVAPVGFQQALAAVGQGDRPFTAVEGHRLRQALAPKVAEIALARVGSLVARVAEIALGHHSKGPDGGQRPALVAVEFVPVIAVDHDLAFEPLRQIKIPQEDIARIVVPFTGIAISFPDIPVAVTRVVLAWIGLTSELDPVDFYVARIVIAVSWITPSRIVAPTHHALLPDHGMAGTPGM